MHLSVVLLMFSLVSVCSWAHRSYTDTRPRKRSSEDRCDTVPCNNTGGYVTTTFVCPSTTCTYNRTNTILSITEASGTEAVSSHIDVNAFGTNYLHQRFYINEADYSNITFTFDGTDRKWSVLNMWSNNCSVSGFWQNSNLADIKCSSSDLILEGKDNSSLALLDVKDSEATVTVDNSSVEKIWIQNSSLLTLDIISSNNIILNIANCIIPGRVSLSHLNINITAQDQKECDQKLVHPYTTTTTTSTTTTTTTPPTTTTQAAHSLHSFPFGYSLFITLIFYLCTESLLIPPRQ